MGMQESEPLIPGPQHRILLHYAQLQPAAAKGGSAEQPMLQQPLPDSGMPAAWQDTEIVQLTVTVLLYPEGIIACYLSVFLHMDEHGPPLPVLSRKPFQSSGKSSEPGGILRGKPKGFRHSGEAFPYHLDAFCQLCFPYRSYHPLSHPPSVLLNIQYL